MKLKYASVFLLGACAGLVTFLGGCLAISSHDMDNTAIDAYEKETAPRVNTSDGAITAGIERWKQLISEFSEENMKGKVADVYAAELFFHDTLKTIRDVEELEVYFLETAEMLKHSSVRYDDVVRGENGDVYVRWKMTYRSKKLAKDQDIVTIGMSHLRFDEEGKVILHQDFWDSTRGIFEHVPLIGAGIRAVKKRL